MMQECQPIDSSVELPVPPATVVQQVLNITQLIPSGPVDSTRTELSPDGTGSTITVNRSHISSIPFYVGSVLSALTGLFFGLGIAQGFVAGYILISALVGMCVIGSFMMVKEHDTARITVSDKEDNTFLSVIGSIDPTFLMSLNVTCCIPYNVSL